MTECTKQYRDDKQYRAEPEQTESKQKKHGSHFTMNSRAYVMPVYSLIGYGIAFILLLDRLHRRDYLGGFRMSSITYFFFSYPSTDVTSFMTTSRNFPHLLRIVV